MNVERFNSRLHLMEPIQVLICQLKPMFAPIVFTIASLHRPHDPCHPTASHSASAMDFPPSMLILASPMGILSLRWEATSPRTSIRLFTASALIIPLRVETGWLFWSLIVRVQFGYDRMNESSRRIFPGTTVPNQFSGASVHFVRAVFE